jgi:hypothetical protein
MPEEKQAVLLLGMAIKKLDATEADGKPWPSAIPFQYRHDAVALDKSGIESDR